MNYADRKKEPYYKEVCEEMLNSLLRIACLDLSEYCDALSKNAELEFKSIAGFALSDFEEAFLPFFTDEKTLDSQIREADGIYTTKVKGADISYDLNKTKNDITKFYNDMISKVQEYINLDMYGGAKSEFKIQKAITEIRQNSAGNNDTVFLLSEHPVFGFIPAVFEKFYDHLMFIHDLSEKNKIKPSREYDKIMRKILSSDPTAPFHFFKTVEDVLDQFHIVEYKTQIANIIDLRKIEYAGTADERLTSMKQYIIGDPILMNQAEWNALTSKQQEFYEKKERRENGIVENILNYYSELMESKGLESSGTLSFEETAKPIEKKASKKAQRGGDQPKISIYQYYDLNSLLYRVSSQAAAFIESSYSELYPAYVLLHQFESFNQGEKSDTLLPKLKALYNEIVYLKDTEVRLDRVIEFSGKKIKKRNSEEGVPFYGLLGTLERNLTAGTNIPLLFEEFYKVFHYLCKTSDDGSKIVYPSILEFLTRISELEFSVGYTKEKENEMEALKNRLGELGAEIPQTEINAMIKRLEQLESEKLYAMITYEEMDANWQAGLYGIRQSKEYVYHYENDTRGFSSEEFITYLLTLRGYNDLSPDYFVSRIFEEKISDEEIDELNTKPEKRKYYVYTYLGDNVFYPSRDAHPLSAAAILSSIKPMKDLMTAVKSISSKRGVIRIETLVLFIFTLLENIMNKTGKKSFFLKENYTHRNFQAKEEWQNKVFILLQGLTTLVQTAITNESLPSELALNASLQSGGKHYPKKTRKMKATKASRKSRKFNKTRRYMKH